MAQFVDDQYEMLILNTLTAKDIYKHLKAAKDTAEAHPRVQGAGTSWLRGGQYPLGSLRKIFAFPASR